jgi:hypothetical protein
MEEKDKIKEGDTVDVYFYRNALFELKVLGTPAATGDSWKLKKIKTGQIFYVQMFEYMKRIDDEHTT